MSHVRRIVYSRPAVVPLDMLPIAGDEFCLRSTTRHHPSTQQRPGLSQQLYGLTLVRVNELYTFSVGSSAGARGGDQAGCCAGVAVAMCDVFLDGKSVDLGATKPRFQRRMISIRLRQNAGFGLERMEII